MIENMLNWLAAAGRPNAVAPAEAKASRSAGVIALANVGRPVWTPRDYAALAREGYAKNPVVYRSVRMIAEAVASLPWLVYEGRAERERHALLDVLARPNPREDGASFLEAVAGHLLVAGNAYVEKVDIEGSVREI
ncbi:MAG TPA: phage portal protein, partial [Hyphomicrobiales bacterium]|nr:phage portal protein [Hyphomicrobiales bacterium]